MQRKPRPPSQKASDPRDSPEEARPLTHVEYHVLVALASGNLHGYAIIKRIMDDTNREVVLEAGTLYGAIKRMRDDGWIELAKTPRSADARRRTYAITELGRDVLRKESDRLEQMLELARRVKLLPGSRKATAPR